MDWVRILAYITGTVNQELLLRNEYLAAENRILKAQLKTPLRLTDAERVTLAEIAHRLGRKALEDVAVMSKHCRPLPQSEFECVCGALGEIGQGRLFIEVDSVWRNVVTTCTA